MRKMEKELLQDFARKMGLGDGCSAIYATLALKKQLTIKEIVDLTGYAYSSVANYLNTLVKDGFVKKSRKNGRNIYEANVDFVGMIKRERRHLLHNIVIPLKNEVKNEELKKEVERLEKYLKKLMEEEK